MSHRTEDAVEIHVAGRGEVLLTCEHASDRLPAPWTWKTEDRWIVGTHWAFDLGAALLARELAAALEATAVLARFSRLLVDPNRPLDSPGLFRTRADGHVVELNRVVGAEDRRRRIDRLWTSYHRAIEHELDAGSAEVVLAVHTFTPIYEGSRRELEVGVLFDREGALARRLAAAIEVAGFRVELNQPYSGKRGMIYSAHRHASGRGLRAVEVEMRQDLAVGAGARARLVGVLAAELAGSGIRDSG